MTALNLSIIKATVVLSGFYPCQSRAFTAAVRAHQRTGITTPMQLTPAITWPPKPSKA